MLWSQSGCNPGPTGSGTRNRLKSTTQDTERGREAIHTQSPNPLQRTVSESQQFKTNGQNFLQTMVNPTINQQLSQLRPNCCQFCGNPIDHKQITDYRFKTRWIAFGSVRSHHNIVKLMDRIQVSLILRELCSCRYPVAIQDQRTRAHGSGSSPKHRAQYRSTPRKQAVPTRPFFNPTISNSAPAA